MIRRCRPNPRVSDWHPGAGKRIPEVAPCAQPHRQPPLPVRFGCKQRHGTFAVDHAVELENVVVVHGGEQLDLAQGGQGELPGEAGAQAVVPMRRAGKGMGERQEAAGSRTQRVLHGAQGMLPVTMGLSPPNTRARIKQCWHAPHKGLPHPASAHAPPLQGCACQH